MLFPASLKIEQSRKETGLKAELAERLAEIVGPKNVLVGHEATMDYLRDETAPAVMPKAAEDIVVVKPGSTEEVSKVLRLANELKVPVFPRGGGTGLVGGAVPTEPGIVLSLERMDRVLEVDKENMMITTEAGVTLRQLEEAAEEAGLFFPPHPGDESATVGGMIACNAGGSRAVKYGVMRSYVVGLEVVLPTGEVLELGGKLLKNVTGYDLMHLFIGSEGTLGVITKAVLRLFPKPKAMLSLVLAYDSPYDAVKTVPEVLRTGIRPLAVEFMGRDVAERSAQLQGLKWRLEKGRFYLYVILEGDSFEGLCELAAKIDEIGRANGALETFVAMDKKDQEELLAIRSKIYSALKRYTLDILDVAVPPARIADFVQEALKLAEEYGVEFLPIYGHAGDGNLHPQIVSEELGGLKPDKLEEFKEKLYDLAVEMGGTITAEHGIGAIRLRPFLRHADRKLIELMRAIKKVFDPNNILNPGKVIPA